ncbi:substrate-binding domain-containing protein [Pedobacter foliorum]|uniref:molybdate ABC transporter substrate-binding protein n=1 Tax=Pedobacter foliorum TaxID=2739058 RepID=UPI001563456E|nr:substrate-binding domain-containing protein [Pedobacter foliorum]NRF38821.1 substrate-binding domain-containing protein [Pedobacter foliorum]
MNKTKLIILILTVLFFNNSIVKAQDHRFDPPWNTPPEAKVQFTIPGIDNIPDIYGDINDPQLVVFFAGNQFMVIDDLMKAFKLKYPQYTRVLAETLPPGILAKQIKEGSIVIGNMRITLKPDVYTAGKTRIDETPEWFSRTELYAKNKLAIMTRKGNPKQVKKLADLGRSDVRVSMPNPEWEGIGKRIEEAYRKVGGEALRNTIMQTKVKDSTTYLTQIHHRQTPMRILYEQSDAGPVWYSEVHYQKMIGHPIESIEIPENENIKAQYYAGQLKKAPHPKAAKDFMDFLVSKEANAIYSKYGFELP